ncbi:hypothetical protein DPQ33_02370 [Oceanidesulfovibrio indonesiensis]|uniref:DUF3313 domain-containing protein n=1 Tax=Oceanidesulfovibrio indonesiensis TaxID=54767 RepID=A0A7M3MHQ5_9BACT|nr:hypothetical protein [Oceanidesulfovibrio indonesiensis]TVM19226.1 hypothetical protein DPQ33_02370 [Oceanidesulfovibrio indonesiensis]
MKKLSTAVILVLMVMALAVAGCKKQTAGSAAAAPAPAQVKTIADFPDHGFNADAYIQGMVKGAPNLLVWQDPAANLRSYNTIDLQASDSPRYVPVIQGFSPTPFIKTYVNGIENYLSSVPKDPNGLRVVSYVVECTPGNRGARFIVGFGAGKAAGAAVVEIYEPGKSEPSMRIYCRETASWSPADSFSLLDHIFQTVANRTGNFLLQALGK